MLGLLYVEEGDFGGDYSGSLNLTYDSFLSWSDSSSYSETDSSVFSSLLLFSIYYFSFLAFFYNLFTFFYSFGLRLLNLSWKYFSISSSKLYFACSLVVETLTVFFVYFTSKDYFNTT